MRAADRGGLAVQLRRVAIASALATGIVACNFLIDFQKDQCETNDDCAARGAAFANTVCGTDKVCTKSATSGEAGGDPCVDNATCTEKNGGVPYACVQQGAACVRLVSEDCTEVIGDFKDPNAVFYGYMAATLGEEVITSTSKNFTNNLRLVVKEFTDQAGGLAPAGPGLPRRAPVFIVCDNQKDPTRVANHLVDDVKVPAIVSLAGAVDDTPIATKITIPKKVLLMSPSEVSPNLTDLADDGLIWRISASHKQQCEAIAKILPEVEAKIRTARTIPNPATNPIKVALVVPDESLGQSLGEIIQPALRYNGDQSAAQNGTNYQRFNIPNPFRGTPDYGPEVAKLKAYAPDVIIGFYGGLFSAEIADPLESDWDISKPRPEYIFTDLTFSPPVLELLTSKPNMMSRVRGVRRVPPHGEPYDGWVLRYKGSFDNEEPLPYTWYLYDSLYVLLYGTVAAGNVPRLDGKALAQGITHLIPAGPAINVGPSQINTAYQVLVTGNNIDLNGVSNSLDFDVQKGEPKSEPLEVACVSVSSGAPQFTSAGQTFDADGNLVGTYACP